MPIKLRCTECDRKLTVDDGFAGGTCRCPYCKALVAVAEARRGRSDAQARPQTPGEGEPLPQALAPGEIPTAEPAKGGARKVLAIGMLVVLLGILVAWLAVRFLNKPADQGDGRPGGGAPGEVKGDGEQPPMPKGPTGPSVCWLEIQAPVVYCIGSKSPRAFDFGVAKTIESIGTLRAGDQYTLVLCNEDGIKFDSDSYDAKAADSVDKARDWFADAIAGASTRIAEAVQIAAKRRPAPKTIVIFTPALISDEDASRIIDAADAAEARIVTIVMTGDKDIIEKMRLLSEKPKTQGKWTVHNVSGIYE